MGSTRGRYFPMDGSSALVNVRGQKTMNDDVAASHDATLFALRPRGSPH